MTERKEGESKERGEECVLAFVFWNEVGVFGKGPVSKSDMSRCVRLQE